MNGSETNHLVFAVHLEKTGQPAAVRTLAGERDRLAAKQDNPN